MTASAHDTQSALDRILTDFVDRTAHVRGAVIGSADGHPISSRLGDLGGPETDAATIAAMGAATVGLSTQLLRLTAAAESADTHVVGSGGQVWVLDVGRSATLTVVTAEHADPAAITAAARRTVGLITDAIERAL